MINTISKHYIWNKIVIAAVDGLAWSPSAISIHNDNPHLILATTHTKKL